MSNPTQSAIIWPEKFLPGTTDNFVTNEVIVKGILLNFFEEEDDEEDDGE